MTALVVTLLTQAPQPVTLTPGSAGCYRVADQTPGWKQAPVPAEALSLAAPAELDQFRSGEKVLVVTQREVFHHVHRRPRWGIVTLDFEVPDDTRYLKVQFLERLDGMRVQVHGVDRFGRSVPLQPERRFNGDVLKVEWAADGVRSVTIQLHHHVRGAPVVADWSSGQWQSMPAAPIARLTWLHPGGRKIELCNSPNQPLHARATALEGVTR